ncbi:MAG TPA: hypothetical protein DF383_05515 [Deltaproteobacteria bacterium]|nr:hypothetical protein [Deltaproteobacteria bacterium]
MNYGAIPAATLAELLLYLNEQESFDSLNKLGTVSRQSFGAALKALAAHLKEEAVEKAELPDFRNWKDLTEPCRKILAKLSPQEAKLLLKGLSA